MSPKRDLVGHSARREEESGLFASELGHMSLEGEHGGLIVDVVADRGLDGVLVHVLGRD